jgi:hypothetical protein
MSSAQAESTESAVSPAQTPSAAACDTDASSCASGSCMFSNYKTLAFMIPFVAVTAYSMTQGSACSVAGGQPCALSAVAVGALAGLTSLGLVTAIKAIRKKTAS